MVCNRKDTGLFGEEVAAIFLTQKGYKILHRNFRCRMGEIDIIAKDGDTTVFIEVRSSRCPSYISPIESILWKKRKKLVMLANFYIKKLGLEDGKCRFDVISVVKEGGVVDIKLIKDAFWEV